MVYFLPAPSSSEFLEHITNHEFQHVADHRWLAEQIFGPIDQWARTAALKNIVFQSTDKFALRHLCYHANYTISPQRVFDFWQDSAKRSGDFFHNTGAGSFPVLQLLRLAPSSNDARTLMVVFEIRPVEIMPEVSLYSRPHQTFSLKNRVLDGNERLRPGPIVDRRIRIPDVQGAATGATIQVAG